MKLVVRIALAFLLILFACGLFLFFQRESLLIHFVNDKLEEVGEKRNILISYKTLQFTGLASVEIKNVSVVPCNRDTFAVVDALSAEVSILKLISGKVSLNSLYIDCVSVMLTERSGVRNFDWIFEKSSYADSVAVAGTPKMDFAKRYEKLIDRVFRFLPDDTKFSNINISAKTNSYSAMLSTQEVKFSDSKFSAEFALTENGGLLQNFCVDGEFSHKNKKMSFNAFSADGSCIHLPYLKQRFDMDLCVDTAKASLKVADDADEFLRLEGDLSLSGFSVDYWRVAQERLVFDDVSVDYKLNLKSDCIELDSASVVRFNKLKFSPFVSYNKSQKLDVRLNEPSFSAADLFCSFPKGMFPNLDGMKVSGTLGYEFFLSVDFQNIDSLKFHSFLDKKDFCIEEFGAVDFRRMSEPFLYEAVEADNVVKSFVVGDENPDFRPLEQISPYLRASVMFSEDGHFFHHKGFLESAIQASLVKNLKEKRFARGGSTISMQLVKNLYLSRDKTLKRKFEEVLIVWLIENCRLVSKERMYEIYLNIIEWGPGIYGAEQAAEFYFGKSADKLTPEEAIFMASVIPRPKKFKYFFDDDGHLRPYLSDYYNVVGGRLCKHGYITEREFERMKPDVTLKGEARKHLKNYSAEEESTFLQKAKTFFDFFKRK